jgi:hypothetical protein
MQILQISSAPYMITKISYLTANFEMLGAKEITMSAVQYILRQLALIYCYHPSFLITGVRVGDVDYYNIYCFKVFFI